MLNFVALHSFKVLLIRDEFLKLVLCEPLFNALSFLEVWLWTDFTKTAKTVSLIG